MPLLEPLRLGSPCPVSPGRRIISGAQAGVDTMRKYALDNGTAPAEPFRIYRKAHKP